MSDRLAVMSNGKVEQLGAPRDVYEHPETSFVADFLGVSNLMRGRVVEGRNVAVGGVTLSAEQGEARGGVVRLTIRPERVRIEPPATEGENRVPATIERFVYLGSTTQVFVALPGGDRVQALVANSGDVEEYDVGAAVTAHLPADALRILADDEAVTA
jgi:ABC-type Fe3+/spermidine/putrescine transport system ATPase subunit